MKNHKKIVLISLLLLAIVFSACQPKVNITTLTELEQSFQDTLDAVVEDNDKVLNAVIMVQGQNFVWKGAAGLADPEASLEMMPDDQYRTASSAKMMLATLTMKLTEMGMIDLDTPIAEYLTPQIMDDLHIYEGVDYSGQITTRHLLHHTSGLADNWTDERDQEHFIGMVLENDPDRFWEPEETIAYVKENLPPLFVPGEDVNYSDINFQLAGLVIESATGKPLHDVYREYLFGPLGMQHTYMELREDPRPSLPSRTLSHVFYEDFDYTNNRAISADWAGGGLVTTSEDMNRFMNAFVKDEIFTNPQTREAMFDWMDWEGDSLDYGLGIMRIQGKTLTVWGHLGVGNAMMFYWPDGDVILTGTLNQQDIDSGAFMSQILKAVRSYQENQ
jgi:D-alanyl-D-alanine carboxypeptidase